MSKMNDYHHKAMGLAARALMERMKGNKRRERNLFKQALGRELSAIAELNGRTIEPTHSVLHRSAATLAMDCGDTILAEHLANRALEENPPRKVAQDLQDILAQVNLQKPDEILLEMNVMLADKGGEYLAGEKDEER